MSFEQILATKNVKVLRLWRCDTDFTTSSPKKHRIQWCQWVELLQTEWTSSFFRSAIENFSNLKSAIRELQRQMIACVTFFAPKTMACEDLHILRQHGHMTRIQLAKRNFFKRNTRFPNPKPPSWGRWVWLLQVSWSCWMVVWCIGMVCALFQQRAVDSLKIPIIPMVCFPKVRSTLPNDLSWLPILPMVCFFSQQFQRSKTCQKSEFDSES